MEQQQDVRAPILSAGAGGGVRTANALIDACVREAQAIVAPLPDSTITVYRDRARVARRSDGFMLVEVPYMSAGDSGETVGSYLAVSRADSTDIDAVFVSDRERLTAGEWAAYVSAERPGNLP